MASNQFLKNFSNKVFIIAEAGVNHNANVDNAKKLIDVAANCGADAIKFQTFKAAECASKYALTAEYQKNNQHLNQYDLLKSLELPFSAFTELKSYAETKNIIFLSTPDGNESLELLLKLNVSAIKIASGEMTNFSFMKKIAQSRLPIILSTGMSTHGEIQSAMNCLLSNGCSDIMLLHCTTSYPAKNEEVNLQVIREMTNIYMVPIGYSDHTIGNEAAIAATALGARIIEKHITLDKTMQGPDHKASMDPIEFKSFIDSIRKTSKLLGSSLKKPTKSEIKTINKVRRGLVANCKIEKGTILKPSMIEIKRPADGIQPSLIEQTYGRIVTKTLDIDQPITWKHLGGKNIIGN